MKDKNNIIYCIDFVESNKNSFSISGWAFSKINFEPLEIELISKNGKVLKHGEMSLKRVDVVNSHKEYEFNNNCGFNISLSQDISNLFGIKFIDKEFSELISVKSIIKKHNANRKVSKRLLFNKVMNLVKLAFSVVFIKHKLIISLPKLKHYFKILKTQISNLKKNEINTYDKWINENLLTDEDLMHQKNYKFSHNHLISILTPTYNTSPKLLDELIESIRNQTYSNWQLCIADANSKKATVDRLKHWENKEKRVNVLYLDSNKGIGENTNEAFKLAKGDYIALCDHDDILSVDALFEVAKTIEENPDADFIYSDEDLLEESGAYRYSPFFKPDFGPDTLRSYNYICHFTSLSKELFEKLGGFSSKYNGSQDYDLFLRGTEIAKKIVHIHKVLYHWRACKTSVAYNPEVKKYAFEAGKDAIQDHLKRLNLEGEVKPSDLDGAYNISYKLKEEPLVSIIIPNKDFKDDLKKCIDSIINKSTYKNYEIIIIENNSEKKEIFDYYNTIDGKNNIKVIKWENEFNYSKINNFGVNSANGEYYIFLNNDTEIITPSWIEQMLEYNQRDDVGVVGAKLYYPDDTVQHGGVIIGIGGVAGHSHKHFSKYDYGTNLRLKIVQNMSAVTAACMMVKAKVFHLVNGFGENFKVAFNDIDFCLKVRQTGKNIVFNPNVELYHYESKSRGYEDTPEKIKRFEGEVDLFKSKWKDILEKGDPYYNKNFTLYKEDFSFKMKDE